MAWLRSHWSRAPWLPPAGVLLAPLGRPRVASGSMPKGSRGSSRSPWWALAPFFRSPGSSLGPPWGSPGVSGGTWGPPGHAFGHAYGGAFSARGVGGKHMLLGCQHVIPAGVLEVLGGVPGRPGGASGACPSAPGGPQCPGELLEAPCGGPGFLRGPCPLSFLLGRLYSRLGVSAPQQLRLCTASPGAAWPALNPL